MGHYAALLHFREYLQSSFRLFALLKYADHGIVSNDIGHNALLLHFREYLQSLFRLFVLSQSADSGSVSNDIA